MLLTSAEIFDHRKDSQTRSADDMITLRFGNTFGASMLDECVHYAPGKMSVQWLPFQIIVTLMF